MPSIVAVTVPVVAFINAFRSVTSWALASAIAPVTLTLMSPSFATVASKSSDVVPSPSTRLPNASLTPAAEKSTVAAFVEATINAPCAAVTASSTVIV